MADQEIYNNDPAVERDMLFALHEVGPDRYRAEPIPSRLLRLYGGQVVAQAVAAIQKTAPADRSINSCHAYFVRPGSIDRPIDFIVSRDRDGQSFSARRVSVEQDGQIILTMAASLHVHEDGPGHQFPMPDVPGPEGLRSMSDYIAEVGDYLTQKHWPFWRRKHLFDWRPVEPFRIFNDAPVSSVRHVWFRFEGTLGGDPAEHQRFFAYVSDLHILHAGLLPLGVGWADEHLQTASLDHAIWFHDRFRVDEWLLYSLDSPAAAGARTLGRGVVHTADGRLVASVAQEGLIRILETPRGDTL
ncbi:acyl-CoA thioesterase II [Sphingobium sp. SCG-1]|uniref:acyl-CoA thioesterase n=1 Tax=Sphingobium sp. SCG-1 TaxID=2072936 RepID=UPI000CD69019|nr:acyl-CoA thioesterase II [Sphingobium sp. SCG-1]AUW60416.1 acyl-CoA thioesterase II [Sphingobium sp. SCG-1]